MNDFTIGLNIPLYLKHRNHASFVMEDIFMDDAESTACFHPFGISAYMADTPNSVEPISIRNRDMVLFLVGRIFNLDELWDARNPDAASGGGDESSDTTSKLTVLFDLYLTYGIRHLLQLLEGDFTMVLVDQRVNQSESRLYVVSDKVGAVPLYITTTTHRDKPDDSDETLYFFSTRPIGNQHGPGTMVPVGTYSTYVLPHIIRSQWTRVETQPYYYLGQCRYIHDDDHDAKLLYHHLQVGIEKRLRSLPKDTYVICAGTGKDDEPEFELIRDMVKSYCVRHHISQVGCVPVGPTNGGEAAWTEDVVRFVATLDIPADHGVQLFLPSGILAAENRRIRDVGATPAPFHATLQYDYEFRRELQTLAASYLIPRYFEPFRAHGIGVTFPMVETTWLDLYLSIDAQRRFQCPMAARLASVLPGVSSTADLVEEKHIRNGLGFGLEIEL